MGNRGRRAVGLPAPDSPAPGRSIAGSSARAKARRLGISDEKQDAEERHARAAALNPKRQTVRLLGRDIPVLAADDGMLRVEDDGKPASAKSVQSYIARAFGDRLHQARAAMEALAASLPPEELSPVAFRLYEGFRPDVPAGARGWGRSGNCGLSELLRRRGDRLGQGRRHPRGRESLPRPAR